LGKKVFTMYKDRIIAFLRKASEPQDVEKIRIACGIGNWNTALKHFLEAYRRLGYSSVAEFFREKVREAIEKAEVKQNKGINDEKQSREA